MSPAANRRGILAMLAAMLCFITNDTLLKLASASLSPGQIMAVRGAFATMMALGIVAAMGQLRSVPKLASPFVLLRAGLESCVAFLFITSLAKLPIANITAITQSTPILMTLAMVVLGLERVRWRRWTAILVGFVGVLVIVRPGPEGFNLYALVALAAAVLVAARDIATRFVPGEVPSTVVTLSTTSAVGLAGLVAGLGETWHWLAPREFAFILGAAVLVTLGNLAVIVAFRGTDVSVVGPFRYSVILWAILSGFVVWGELPDATAFIGIALIVGSGIYMIHREQVRQRQALRAAALEVREAA
ncbi:MAG TPA: DMT family transporter [Beijerinckiaceae bacterium]|jgi:drug/metabolite transporter (DMT)-like permease